MAELIRLDHVSYSYDSGSSLIKDISLSIDDNEFIAIIGQNGAGKTTVLKMLTGLLRPNRGDIYVRGRNTREMSVSALSAGIGFVMQNPDRQLFAETVHAEIAFALKNAGLAPDEIERRVEKAMAVTGLQDREAFPPALSRGDRAKTVLASVVAMGPGVIILDEPTGGQDYRNSRLIMDIVSDLHQKGHTIIFVTHNMSLAAEYARRLIVLQDGRIVQDGTASEIFNQAVEGSPVLPPQITRLSRELKKELPLERDALTPPELAGMLLALKKKG